MKPMENILFASAEKATSKRYKANGILAVLSQNAKERFKTLGKHYVEKVLKTHFGESEHLSKTNGKSTFASAEKSITKSYKANGISFLFERKCEKAFQKHWKSISQRRFSKRISAKAENLIQPMENQLFASAENRHKTL